MALRQGAGNPAVSFARYPSAMIEAAPSLPISPAAILREFGLFLRRPRVIVPSGLRSPADRVAWGWLALLLIGGLAGVLMPLLGWWQAQLGLPSPDAFDGMAPALLIPAVVLAAPVAEELLFRGWQTGRARALWLALCAGAALLALLGFRQIGALPALGLLLVLLVAAPLGWWKLRHRAGAPGWFLAAYPPVFHAVAIGFALAHLVNYPALRLAALPMVLPQFWAGLVLGYMRQRIGLVPAMLAHAASNAFMLALALLAGG